MRLHRLAITGFGPFAGSEQVDLDALTSSGLFLIHGPTGAGKTSILDAICFALYGAVPGARSGSRASLRSDHAGEGVIPEVTLELTAGGRRLRVRRSPEFSRPKKRGTGDTTVPAKVVLEELVGSGWVDRGTRNDEVAMVLKDVVGMGLEQFIKVVLLPQGDFASFLRASPEERRSVLERLFDTSRFTDVEAWLAERRRQLATALGTTRARLSTALVRVDDVIARLEEGDDIMRPAWSDIPDQDVDSVLMTLTTAVDSRASTALAKADFARAAVIRTTSAVHSGAAVIGHQKTASDARDRLRSLDGQRGIYEDALRTVGLSERAGAVSGFVAAVESASQKRDSAHAQVADLRVPLALVVDNDADTKAVLSLIDQVTDHDDALQEVVSQASRVSSLAAESARHSQAALLDHESAVELAGKRAELEERRAVAESDRDRCRAALTERPALEARYKVLSRIQQLLGDQDRSAGDLQTLQHQADLADRSLLDVRERVVDLRERRLAGMSAELASGLEAGDPCPVCGACAHPMPAMATDVVSPNDIRMAEADHAAATEALSLVRSKVSAELAGRDARMLELASEATMAETDVPLALSTCTAAIANARSAASALPEADAAMVALDLEVERLRVLLDKAVAARALSLAHATSTRAQSQSAAAEVADLLTGHGQTCPCRGDVRESARGSEVSEVVVQHRQTLAGLRALATKSQELSTREDNARDAVISLSIALQENDFETMAQARAALLLPAKVADLTAYLRATELNRAEASALLGQSDVKDALKMPTPDVDALAEAHAKAATLATDAGRQHTLSEQAQRDLRSLSVAVHQALADLGPAEEEAQLVQELADCVGGNSADNELRMRLSSYVLAARLAEIATLANERLRTMSDGRYALEYTDARAARGARSGLGLLVQDAWTGRSRETSSLSGGEAFMASLALALGLGDAVRAEAGGFDLQTLFVDEGFGTLDEDSLEQVMAVLDTLREGGRAVGIVSHVPELRQRIPQQLRVLKGEAGSLIRTQNLNSPTV